MLLNKKQNHIFIEVERYFGETDLDLGFYKDEFYISIKKELLEFLKNKNFNLKEKYFYNDVDYKDIVFEKDIFSFSIDFIEYKTNKDKEKKFIKSIFEKIRKYQNEQYLSYFSEEDEF